MGIIYDCFRECTNSLAVYFLTAECGFTKPIKEALGQRRQEAVGGGRVKAETKLAVTQRWRGTRRKRSL